MTLDISTINGDDTASIANATLTNGDKTFTVDHINYASILGFGQKQSDGQYYFESTYNSVTSGDWAIGVSGRPFHTATNNVWVGGQDVSIGIFPDSGIWTNGSLNQTITAPAVGDVIGCLVTIAGAVRTVQFSINGVFEGTPVEKNNIDFFGPMVSSRNDIPVTVAIEVEDLQFQPVGSAPFLGIDTLLPFNISGATEFDHLEIQQFANVFGSPGQDDISSIENQTLPTCFSVPSEQNDISVETIISIDPIADTLEELCQGSIFLTVGEIVTGDTSENEDPTFTNIITGNVCAESVPIVARIFAISLSTGRSYETTSDTNGDYAIDTFPDTGFFILVRAQEYGIAFPSLGTVAQGDRIHPSTPNGFVYDALTAGTTGANEPVIWPTATAVLSGDVLLSPVLLYRPEGAGYVEGVFTPI